MSGTSSPPILPTIPIIDLVSLRNKYPDPLHRLDVFMILYLGSTESNALWELIKDALLAERRECSDMARKYRCQTRDAELAVAALAGAILDRPEPII